MLAASAGHQECVETILEEGGDSTLMAVDEEGRTALQWAALKGESGIVKALIDQGADCNVVDHFGCTPLDWVRRLKYAGGLLKMMEEAGAVSACERL